MTDLKKNESDSFLDGNLESEQDKELGLKSSSDIFKSSSHGSVVTVSYDIQKEDTEVRYALCFGTGLQVYICPCMLQI
eukprot:Pgem_evm1s13314